MIAIAFFALGGLVGVGGVVLLRAILVAREQYREDLLQAQKCSRCSRRLPRFMLYESLGLGDVCMSCLRCVAEAWPIVPRHTRQFNALMAEHEKRTISEYTRQAWKDLE